LHAKLRSEKGQTRNHSTANNFISPSTVAQKIQTSRTEGFEITTLMACACHKLAWIKEVWMLNLGVRKVKQETAALQITLFYPTP